jgi:alpha-1,3-mannosyltransferase
MFGVGDLSVRFVLVTLFTSNFIGVVFARTLHYQFYCWYFHTLPLLVWHARPLHVYVKIALLAAIELCFNIYPATWWSSALLQVGVNLPHRISPYPSNAATGVFE